MSGSASSIWRRMNGRQICGLLRRRRAVAGRPPGHDVGDVDRWCGRARSPPACGRAVCRSGRRRAGPRCPRRGRALRRRTSRAPCGLPSANTSCVAVALQRAAVEAVEDGAQLVERLRRLRAASRAAMRGLVGRRRRRSRRRWRGPCVASVGRAARAGCRRDARHGGGSRLGASAKRSTGSSPSSASTPASQIEVEQFAGGLCRWRASWPHLSTIAHGGCAIAASCAKVDNQAIWRGLWPMRRDLPAREAMEFDVVIVGAGPAGLAAAIRLKQINAGHLRRRGGEGLRGRRAYPLRRGDRSDRSRPAAAGMAQRGHADQDRGHRRPLLLARRQPARCGCRIS